MDEFESFTRDKITRLRAEADALEKILKEFQGTKARQAGASRRSGGDQPRAGAFGVVMEAIVAAGADGLTLDQMIQAAEAEGYEVKRPTLRAQVWKAKEDGMLTQLEPGRYRSSAFDAFEGVKIDPPDHERADRTRAFFGASDDGEAGFQPVAQRARRIPRTDLAALLDDVPPAPDLDDEIPF